MYALILSDGSIEHFVSVPDGKSLSDLEFLTEDQKGRAVEIPSDLTQFISLAWKYENNNFKFQDKTIEELKSAMPLIKEKSLDEKLSELEKRVSILEGKR